MKTVYFMRHGETDLNRQGRMQGQSDYPLNDTGRAQALQAGARFAERGLRFDRVISSPLSRALETAALASGYEAERIDTDPRLMEMGYGPYESLVFQELSPEVFRFLRDPEHVPAPEGMEPIPALVARLGDFLEDLRQDEREEQLLVVCHGVALRAAIRNLLDDAGAWKMPIENCVLYRCAIEDGRFSPIEKLAFDEPEQEAAP